MGSATRITESWLRLGANTTFSAGMGWGAPFSHLVSVNLAVLINAALPTSFSSTNHEPFTVIFALHFCRYTGTQNMSKMLVVVTPILLVAILDLCGACVYTAI